MLRHGKPASHHFTILGLKLIELDTIPVEQLQCNHLGLDTPFMPICFAKEPETLQTPGGSFVGKLNPHYSKILRVLRNGDSIQWQAYLAPAPSRHGGRGRSKPKGKQTMQQHTKHATLSVILYGSMDMFELVGDFLSGSSEFLQSPLRCDRNVPYRNPQNLAGRDENPTMTYQLQEACPNPMVETIVQDADPSAALENNQTFAETEAPAAVKSSLYRYILTER